MPFELIFKTNRNLNKLYYHFVIPLAKLLMQV